MLALTLRGLGARKLRSALTALAVFFGVAMVAGTFMLTDSVNSSFDDIFEGANEGVDVAVSTKETLDDSRGAGPPAFDERVLENVLSVDGAAEAVGQVYDPTISVLDEQGDRVGPAGPPHIAMTALSEPFSPWSYTEGRPPETADEIGIDNFTAEREGWTVGDLVRIAGTGGAAKEYAISGVAEFGDGTELLGASLAILTLPEAQRLAGKEGQLDEILVAAEEGVTPEELKLAVQDAVPAELQVETGEENAAAASGDFKDGFSFLSNAMLVFGGIALFVGGFIIFNTFSITVAQRTREFGMLRTIGAHRRQILGAVLLEAAVIGLAASVLGIFGGIGFVAGIMALFGAFGLSMPSSGLVLAADTVIVALLVGVVVTIVAALAPARRATRVTPLEAVREGGVTVRPSLRRTIVGVVVLVLGILAILRGLFGTESFGAAFVFLGPGILLLFLGVALLSSRLIGPLASVIGWPLERFGGVPGQLARENTQRNKSRTATTAAALMIGLALVVFVATFASALTKSIDEVLDRQFAGDLVLQNSDGGFLRISPEVAGVVGEVEGVAAASPGADADALVAGTSGTQLVAGLDPTTVTRVVNFDWREGSDATLEGLGTGGAIIEADWGADNGIAVGDTMRVTTPLGTEVRYTVEGSVRDEVGLVISTFAIPRDTLLLNFGVDGDSSVLVLYEEGVDPVAVRADVDRVLQSSFPNVESRSQAELEDDFREGINQTLVLIYALLALSIVIALFGVVNTLVLTIHERTREIGMLRAIGTSRRQVRRMIRYESVITAMIGGVVGAAIGLALAVVAVEALADEGLVLSIPYPLLVAALILAAVAGVAAAIAPARRAARIDIMEALLYE
jgi:putative ABC transport system permease protein